MKMQEESALKNLQAVRDLNPVIHCLTNYVSMQTMANCLLAIGASPIMAHAIDELNEIIKCSHALVLNIGTLDKHWLESIEYAQQLAIANNKKIVFDPVGAGASQFRLKTSLGILQRGVTVIRGNASEIIALAEHTLLKNAIDSQHDSNEALFSAKQLSAQYNCLVIVSGKTDIVVSATEHLFVEKNISMFTHVTAMGCTVTSLVAAFLAASKDDLSASAAAMYCFTHAGEIAMTHSRGPGSFSFNLIDALFSM